jgi:hypothetical protein
VREELRRSDERREVVRAAEAWRAAGAIDDAALAAIRARHPDDRRRARPGFRLLFFVFTLLAVQALFFFCATFFGRGFLWGSGQTLGIWQVFFALGCGLAAEGAIASLRMRGFGIDEALVALAVGFATGAVALLLGPGFEGGSGTRLIFAALAGSAAFAAWRWGIAPTGVAAGIGLFGALYWTPAPRAAWLVAGSLGAVAARRGARHSATAPAHRDRWSEIYVVAVLALYAALHVWGFGTRRIDSLQSLVAWALDLPPSARVAAWAAMVALPAGLVSWGVRQRDALTLALGALLGIATGATVLIELDWGPPWLRLMAGGAALLGAALALRRRFAGRAQRTVAGFTDLALFEAGRTAGLLEMAAVVAVFTPEPQASPEREGFRGDGGEFGGGGASGKF